MDRESSVATMPGQMWLRIKSGLHVLFLACRKENEIGWLRFGNLLSIASQRQVGNLSHRIYDHELADSVHRHGSGEVFCRDKVLQDAALLVVLLPLIYLDVEMSAGADDAEMRR